MADRAVQAAEQEVGQEPAQRARVGQAAPERAQGKLAAKRQQRQRILPALELELGRTQAFPLGKALALEPERELEAVRRLLNR
jgi:hypothetical protein